MNRKLSIPNWVYPYSLVNNITTDELMNKQMYTLSFNQHNTYLFSWYKQIESKWKFYLFVHIKVHILQYSYKYHIQKC